MPVEFGQTLSRHKGKLAVGATLTTLAVLVFSMLRARSSNVEVTTSTPGSNPALVGDATGEGGKEVGSNGAEAPSVEYLEAQGWSCGAIGGSGPKDGPNAFRVVQHAGDPEKWEKSPYYVFRGNNPGEKVYSWEPDMHDLNPGDMVCVNKDNGFYYEPSGVGRTLQRIGELNKDNRQMVISDKVKAELAVTIRRLPSRYNPNG